MPSPFGPYEHSQTAIQWYFSTSSLRISLTRVVVPPCQALISREVAALLTAFLAHDHLPLHQFEDAWGLTNMASGTSDQTRLVVECDAVPQLVRLVMSTNDKICDQVMWALGNIAGDSPVLRDFVLEAGGMLPLLHQVHSDEVSTSMLKNATRCWVTFVVARLVRASSWCARPCRRCTDVQVQTLIDQGMLPRLLPLFHIRKENIGEEECWTVRTLSAGSMPHIQAIVDAHIVPPMVELLTTGQFNMQKEAAWVILHATSCGSRVQTQYLVEQDRPVSH
ncbi:hypothetical protein DYB37_006420 [Aphanomyces astaci]|uniref:IBB domain-containing protein n=2 Tax=Aphanomyces astaci TaxID=112090 RepID=A0A3R6X8M8_APHAT|nr:hypothetical protein DYB37_006420 [Aphanomyces astaci]